MNKYKRLICNRWEEILAGHFEKKFDSALKLKIAMGVFEKPQAGVTFEEPLEKTIEKTKATSVQQPFVYGQTRASSPKNLSIGNGIARTTKAIAEASTEKVRSRLVQLKYMMEDHLELSYYDPAYNFAYFLGQYIERLGIKHKAFAEAISLLPTELSQILNQHRRPKDKLAFRLALHSAGSFPAQLWFKIIQKDRLYELFHDDSYLQREKEFVKCTKNILQEENVKWPYFLPSVNAPVIDEINNAGQIPSESDFQN